MLARASQNLLLFSLLLLIPCLTACGGASVHSPALPPPGAELPLTEYRIQPGDQLEIKFFYNAELNEQVTVRPDGKISLQLVNEVPASGMTVPDLTRRLKELYAAELNSPEITVLVRSFSAQVVFVDGEVTKPGSLGLVSPLTVMESIAQAGGMKDTARAREVVIIRRASGDGRTSVFVVNLEQVRDGSDPTQDIALVPRDIVYVPRSAIANLNLWVDQYLRRMVPIGAGVNYEINRTRY